MELAVLDRDRVFAGVRWLNLADAGKGDLHVVRLGGQLVIREIASVLDRVEITALEIAVFGTGDGRH